MKTGILTLLAALLLPFLAWSQDPVALQSTTQLLGARDTVSGHPYPNYPQWGVGVSCVDFNQDGWDDISLATGHGRDPMFYTNNGDGTFTKIASPVSFPYHNKMILWADYDNDGDKDLFLTGFKAPNALYENDGAFNFTDVTAAAGIPVTNDWSWGASWTDYNKDGWLDLYICNRSTSQFSNYLWKNNGNGTFTEVSRQAGVTDGTQPTFQSNFIDYNNDGWLDLYVANDRLYGNTLFKNNGDETFTDISTPSGAGIQIDAMNTGSGDFNNDGFYDIYITNTPNGGNVLLRNNGDETFSDISASAGIQAFNFFWAGNWVDIENDTDVDLYVSCMKPFDVTPNKLYINQWADSGMETFVDHPMGPLGDTLESFSNAIFDYNNDGRMDIIVPNNGSDSVQIWKNVASNSNNYIKFSLEGTIGTLEGVGTTIEVYLASGVTMKRTLLFGDAYLNQNSSCLQFGVGTATVIDSVKVRWLSGITDALYDVAVNQKIHVVENSTNTLDIEIDELNANCNGPDNGEATAIPLNGMPPYIYLWSNGENTASISGLAPGNYLVTVVDANGERGIGFGTIADDANPAISMTMGNSTDGVGGWVDLTVNSGTAPFTYAWDNSETTEDLADLGPGAYEVTVTDANGCTSEARIGVYDNIGPCQPFIPTSIVTTQVSAVLNWDPIPTGEAFRARYREQGTSTWTLSAVARGAGATSITIEGLSPNTTYEYETKSKCTDGKSPFSDTYTFTTDATGPGVCGPWVPHTVASDSDEAVIEWDEQPNADKYRIRYREQGTTDWTEQAALWAMITLGGLTPNTVYEYQSSSLCSGHWTDYSATTYTFSTGALPPSTPVINGEPGTATQTEARDIEDEWFPTAADVFSMFPNPATDVLNINFAAEGTKRLQVLTSNGQVLRFVETAQLNYNLDVTELPAGVYFVTVIAADGNPMTQRFVKTNR